MKECFVKRNENAVAGAARHEVLTSDAPETLAKWIVAVLGADLGVEATIRSMGMGVFRIDTKTVVVTIRPS